jgi:hypothetical protein
VQLKIKQVLQLYLPVNRCKIDASLRFQWLTNSILASACRQYS